MRLAALAAAAMLASQALAQPGPEVSAGTFVHAEPQTLVEPVYPDKAVRAGREGWVDLRFTVRTDGTVADVELLDASGKDEFERTARKALAKWTFKPATLNGAVVEQRNFRYRLTFRLSGGGPAGATREFARGLEAVDRLLDEGKLEEACARMDALDRGSINLYEYAYLFSRRAHYHAARNEVPQALHYLGRATRDSRTVERAFLPKLLLQKLALELVSQRFGDALETWRSLREAGATLPPELSRAVERLQALKSGSEPFSLEGRLEALPADEDGNAAHAGWSYVPLRRTIAVEPVSGRLDRLFIRCATRTFGAEPRADTLYSIPASWGDCEVELRGEPGATFLLVEDVPVPAGP